MELEVFSMDLEEYSADLIWTPVGNDTVSAESLHVYRHGTGPIIALVTAYLAVLLVGVAGNVLVIAVMSKSPRMRTVTNYFITNLAIADLLVLVVCLPPTLITKVYVRK